MLLPIFLSIGIVACAVASAPAKPKTSSSPTATTAAPVSSKQVAESNMGRLTDFLKSMQGQVSKAEAKAAVAKANQGASKPAKANPLSRKERKALKKVAKSNAKKAVIAQRGGDPDEDLLSVSASVSFERKRAQTDHFSFSESEHYRDCSTTSSSSSSSGRRHCKKDAHKKKKGYRLRHCRVHSESQRYREKSGSLSISASIDDDLLGADASGSLSASAERKARRRTVLRVCEDELARKRKHSRRTYGESCDPYVRVDYRKKVFFNDDAKREFSASASLSLSIEEP